MHYYLLLYFSILYGVSSAGISVVASPLRPNLTKIMSIDQNTWIYVYPEVCRCTVHPPHFCDVCRWGIVVLVLLCVSDLCHALTSIHIYIERERERERDPTHQHVENTPAARCTILTGTPVAAADASGEGSPLGCCCSVALATTTTTTTTTTTMWLFHEVVCTARRRRQQ